MTKSNQKQVILLSTIEPLRNYWALRLTRSSVLINASIRKKVNNKLKVVAQIAPYMDILLNAFFDAQINYCPLMQMFHDRCNDNKTKYLHERYIRLICIDNVLHMRELLQKEESVSMYHKKIRTC